MPQADLDAYEAAYARVERQLHLDRNWSALERRMRWRLATPTWQLVRTLLIIALAATAALMGRWQSWGLAIGLALAVLPSRIAAVRQRRRTLAEIETAEDVRRLCMADADAALKDAVMTLILRIVLSVLFGAFALLLFAFGKQPLPSTIVAALLLLDGLLLTFVHIPRLSRESRSYRTDEERAAEGAVADDA